MRTTSDRIRHTILFEFLLVAVCTPLLSLILHREPADVGGMTLAMSLTAMIGNFFYNYAFDRILLRVKRPLYPRGFRLRMVHSVAFEFVLLFLLIPIIMLWSGYGFWEALALEIGFALFVPIYALGFNWGYDLLFPAPAGSATQG